MNEASTVAATGSRRLGWSLAASCAAHAAMALLAIRAAVSFEPPRPVIVLPVSLVSLPGGGGGARGPEPAGPPPAAEPPPAPPPVAAPVPTAPPAQPRVARKPKPAPAKPEPTPAAEEPPPATAAVSGGSGTATGGGPSSGNGGGGGDGTGGDGTGGARVAYGTNPLPPYPLAARRLGHEGVVLLEVLVAADGHAAEVAIARSSGHPTLDESAVSTVRERWRFVPARRDGQPVASRVTVPIRFRLDEIRGS